MDILHIRTGINYINENICENMITFREETIMIICDTCNTTLIIMIICDICNTTLHI